MTRDEFVDFLNVLNDHEQKLFAFKNSLYAINTDIADNFKRGAAVLGISPEKYLVSLVVKHVLALANVDQLSQEIIEEYARDIRIYMALLMAMVSERKF